MERLDRNSYDSMPDIIGGSAGAVYPRSIAEKKQSGDIYVQNGSALFWHFCGFALIFGDCGGDFLESVFNRFLRADTALTRRFVMFVTDDAAESFFRGKKDLVFGKRYFFSYQPEKAADDLTLPEGYAVRGFDEELFDAVGGRVTPRMFWKDSREFMKSGKGVCIMHGGEAAAWAFSAAVSDEEIDIGIETSPLHRQKGLASIAAKIMTEYCTASGKRPVWACDAANEASYALAVKSGFVKTAECTTVKQMAL